MEQKHLTPRLKGAEAQRKQSTFTFERGRGQNKKMLEIDVGSGNVIENKKNDDILSCYLSDILGNSEPVLMENAPLGATKITFAMRFNRQCTALAMPRRESQNLTDARRTNYPRLDLDVVRPVRLAPHFGAAHARLKPGATAAANIKEGKRSRWLNPLTVLLWGRLQL
jgi:hypothetical protein